MFTAATTLILMVVIFAVVLFLARWILRLAIKLAFIAAIVIALGGGGLFGWWRGWFDWSTQTQRPATQTNQTRNANRRPAAR